MLGEDTCDESEVPPKRDKRNEANTTDLACSASCCATCFHSTAAVSRLNVRLVTHRPARG